jgi:hypothetical protein
MALVGDIIHRNGDFHKGGSAKTAILIMARSSAARRSEATLCDVNSLTHRAKIALFARLRAVTLWEKSKIRIATAKTLVVCQSSFEYTVGKQIFK